MAPAKINLALDVLGRREDGFHQVSMVMQTIALADEVVLKRTELPVGEIELQGDCPLVPWNQSNLAFRAADLLKQRGYLNHNVSIFVEKKVPVAAGLAGGSSDAAAVLRGLNQLLKLEIAAEELERLAAELGSDIPFLIRGGTALATGRGEKVQSIKNIPDLYLVLVKPPYGVSTPEAYKGLNAPAWRPSNHADNPRGPITENIMECIENGDLGGLIAGLGNDLEKATIAKHPELGRWKEQLLCFGADNALMSGSGPTIFGIMREEKQAEKVFSEMRTWLKPDAGTLWLSRTITGEEIVCHQGLCR